MVGVFLDQRDVRECIKTKYAKGKRVLNTFSYTGAFSVVSAIGGAKETTSVDLAKRSLPKTTEQFKINGINLSNQKIVVADVFDNFKFALKKGYTKLLKEVIAITDKNGVIVASTNAANFTMSRFKIFIDKAFKDLNIKYKIEQIYSLPKDFRVSPKFPEGNYLKVVFIRLVD